MRLAYGAVQRRATLDHLIETLAERPVEQLEPLVLAALRLGLYQLAYADRVPAHAAVGESVELVKRESPGGAKLVNAVLRRGAREVAQLIAALDDATPEQAALRHSHPRWIAELWWESLGPDAARALMAADNRPAEAVLRVNTLRADPAELAARLPVASSPAPGLPEGLVLEGPFDAFASPEWERGSFMPQSRASMMVARLLAPRPGERVLDLCAAPGGKTTHLAALMGGDGELVAVERHPGRADALRRTAARMGGDGRGADRRRRRRHRSPAASTASWSTRRARTWARWRRALTRAGASRRTSRRGWRASRPRSCARAPRRCARAARSSTPRARSRRPRTRTW